MRTITLLLLLPSALRAQQTWSLRTTPAHSRLSQPAGKAGTYLIPTSGFNTNYTSRIYLRSPNGVQWTLQPLPATVGDDRVVCLNNRFVGIGGEKLWWSDNGLTITETIAPPSYPQGIAYGNGVWVIALQDGRVLRSTTNAASWQEIPTQAASLGAIVFGAGKFIIDAGAGSLQSTDGQTWIVSPGVPQEYPNSLFFEAATFLTASHKSADGLTWQPVTHDVPGELSLRTGAGQFLTWGSGSPSPVFWTSTGNEWSGPFAAPVIDTIRDAAFCGDLWIAITASGKVLTSPLPTAAAPVAPALNVATAVRLTWSSSAGRSYIIQRSPDMAVWTDYTGVLLGTGAVMEWVAPAAAGREFFRVQVR